MAKQQYIYDGSDWVEVSSAIPDLTNYATKVYADAAASNAAASLVDSAPSTLNTLNELAAALGDDANFATTITNALSPIGSVTAYAMATPPAGWLLCDGTVHNISSYPTLGTGLGSTYGGNGTTTFAVPNLKGRVITGKDADQDEFNLLGETGGSKTSVAPHTHGINHDHPSFATTDGAGNHSHYAHGGTFLSGVPGNYVNTWANVDGFLRETSGSGAHNHTIDVPAFTGTSGVASAATTSGNLQPYLVMNYIIRAI